MHLVDDWFTIGLPNLFYMFKTIYRFMQFRCESAAPFRCKKPHIDAAGVVVVITLSPDPNASNNVVSSMEVRRPETGFYFCNIVS